MGFTPEQVGRMSFWQFLACADGWAKSHDPSAAKRSNDAEDFGSVEQMLDDAPDVMR